MHNPLISANHRCNQPPGRDGHKMITNPLTDSTSTRLSWSAIQAIYVTSAAEHLVGAEILGLSCPLDVFEQLFHDHTDDSELAGVLRLVDWSAVRWEQSDLSGIALRCICVPRSFQHAVDEARWRTAEAGFSDARPEVMAHWAGSRTWSRAPIVVAGDVLQTGLDELIVGFTRLGNLLGALDSQDLLESSRHHVWIGRAA